MLSKRKPEANPAVASLVASVQSIHTQYSSFYRISGCLWQFPGLVSDGAAIVCRAVGAGLEISAGLSPKQCPLADPPSCEGLSTLLASS